MHGEDRPNIKNAAHYRRFEVSRVSRPYLDRLYITELALFNSRNFRSSSGYEVHHVCHQSFASDLSSRWICYRTLRNCRIAISKRFFSLRLR